MRKPVPIAPHLLRRFKNFWKFGQLVQSISTRECFSHGLSGGSVQSHGSGESQCCLKGRGQELCRTLGSLQLQAVPYSSSSPAPTPRAAPSSSQVPPSSSPTWWGWWLMVSVPWPQSCCKHTSRRGMSRRPLRSRGWGICQERQWHFQQGPRWGMNSRWGSAEEHRG